MATIFDGPVLGIGKSRSQSRKIRTRTKSQRLSRTGLDIDSSVVLAARASMPWALPRAAHSRAQWWWKPPCSAGSSSRRRRTRRSARSDCDVVKASPFMRSPPQTVDLPSCSKMIARSLISLTFASLDSPTRRLRTCALIPLTSGRLC